MKYKYGHFAEDGTEFIITDPNTPRSFDNFIWNDSMFSCIQQTGTGYFDYQIGEMEAVQLFTGTGRICDFDVFGREGLMSRIIYLRDNDSGEFWTINWEPVLKGYQNYSCTHGLGYSIINNRTEDIEGQFRIFAPGSSDPVEIWSLSMVNRDNKKRNLSLFAYNQFSFSYKWGFDSYGDMIYRSSKFDPSLNAVLASKHPHRRPHDYLTGFMTSDKAIGAFDGSRDFFVGTYRTLAAPKAVVEGACSNGCGSSDSTIGVAQYDFSLMPGERYDLTLLVGASNGEESVSRLRQRYLSDPESWFEKLKENNKAFIDINRIETPDDHFNRMANIWIKHQTSYGAKWCRWGWMGYRDIVQHGYGVSSLNQNLTKDILEKAFRHQNSDGLALRGWNPVDKKAYSDSALWLVFSLIAYLKESGDYDFLRKDLPFYDRGRSHVMGHIERSLDFLEDNKGVHGLLLIKYGDWNDSLTAIGSEGRGESIWLSMAYTEACRQMSALMSYLGSHDHEDLFVKRAERMHKAVNAAAWDGDWYIRCFDDNGRPVGSKENEQGQIFLNTQSWAMISGICDEKRRDALVKSCDERLSTEMGYLLLHPTFLRPDDHVGRISYLEPGICENGTVYSHGNAFMVLGLLRQGMVDKAYEIFKEITPGYLKHGDSAKQNNPPYVFANGYWGPEHRNRPYHGEFTWITGSVAWMYNLIIQEFAGVYPGYNAIEFKPNLPTQWDRLALNRRWRGKEYRVVVERTGKSSVTINGKSVDGGCIGYDESNIYNDVIITI